MTSIAARSRSACSSASSASVCDDGSAGRVDQDRAVGHRGEERGVDEPAGGVGQGDEQDDDVGLGQEVGQLVGAVHALAGPGADEGHRPDVERGEAARGLLGEVARADEQHPLAEQGVGDVLVPVAGQLVAHEGRDLAHDREDRREHPLRGDPAVRALAVGEGDALGEVADELLRARREQLDEPHLRARLDHRRRGVLGEEARG